MKLNHALRLEFPSRLEELELLDRLLDVFLDHGGVAEDTRSNLALSIREAAANAVTHGNDQAPERPTAVTAVLGPGELVVEVVDNGPGFDLDAVPDPLAPENLLKPSGRGILLMRNFMDEVGFEFPDAGGTVVRMRKALEAEPADRPEPSA